MPSPHPYRGTDREFIESRLDTVVNYAKGEGFETGVFNIVDGVKNSIAMAVGESARQQRKFALALDQLEHNDRTTMTNAHYQIGKHMQEVTVRAYDFAHNKARSTLGRLSPKPYRLSERDAGGRLRAALNSDSFFRATYDGIGFVNVSLLDRTARQWHRLNFGARPNAGSPQTAPRTAKWGDVVLGAFGFLDEEPSRSFVLPKGFFTEEGAFYPIGHPIPGITKFGGASSKLTPAGPKTTKGIQAWNFLDAGVYVLSQDLGPTYENVYNRWVESAKKGAGPLSRVVSTGGRPRKFAI